MPTALFRLWELYKGALASHPLLTKSTTAGLIMSASDVLCQTLEVQSHSSLTNLFGSTVNLQNGCPSFVDCPKTVTADDTLLNYNVQRTLHVGVTGLCWAGPISHGWYKLLESMVRMRHPLLGWSVRMLLDAVLFSPVAIAGYFGTRTVLELFPSNVSKLYDTLALTFQHKFVKALQASWSFWPLANAFNFALVPVPFRVLYNNALSVFWNTYLTHLNSTRLEQVVSMQQDGEDIPDDHVVRNAPCACSHCRALRG